MNVRAVAAEVAALAASALWVYGGIALAVAAVGDGASASLGAAAAVVALSYGLARLLQRFDISEEATRFWGAGLSVGLLYLILRIEIVGEPYLWELGWLRDLLSEPGRTLEGRAGDVTEVVLLSAAWVWGVQRGVRALTFERVLAEVSPGLVVVLLAAAFAPAADAPAALHWLPVPYMVAGLLALALAHLRPVQADRRRPFLGVWALWTGGSLGAMAGLALLAALFDPPSLKALGEGLVLAARGLSLAVVYLLSPVIFAMGWTIEHLFGWLVSGNEFTPEPTDTSELIERMEEESEPARWSRVLGYVLRSGLVVLVIAAALFALWLAFRRLRRRHDEVDEIREEVESSGPLGDLRSMFAGAFGRLRVRSGGPTGRDPIGRLYLSMLRHAMRQGLARPPSDTPLEFAPRLEEHFGSSVPGAVSRAFAKARYGSRPPPPDELAELRVRWEQVARGGP